MRDDRRRVYKPLVRGRLLERGKQMDGRQRKRKGHRSRKLQSNLTICKLGSRNKIEILINLLTVSEFLLSNSLLLLIFIAASCWGDSGARAFRHFQLLLVLVCFRSVDREDAGKQKSEGDLKTKNKHENLY